MIDTRAIRTIVLALSVATASCTRRPPPAPPPAPLPPDVEAEMYAAVLERVLVSGVVQAGDPVAAICLGFGPEAEPPSVDLLFRFMGGQPPLYGSTSCTRSINPETSLPVVQTLEGAPGLFLSMVNAPFGPGRVVSMRFERTGARPLTLRCRVDIGRGAPPPGAPPDAPTVVFRIGGC